MLAIDALLRLATCSPADTIVHVGAGSGAVLDRYVHLSPSKVVLVEGDPVAAAALQRAAPSYPWAEVVAQAADIEDGEVVWNRYNLSMLNGPVAADALKGRYPRLRRESVASVPGIALSSLLQSVLENADPNGSTTLLLDVPGQEGALLESLRDELSALAAVIVRRCALPLPRAADWPTVQEQMRERSFELVGHETDGEPLWPVAVFRLDRRRRDAAMLGVTVDGLQTRLGQLEAELSESRTGAIHAAAVHAEEAKTLSLARAAAEKLAAKRDQLMQQATKTRNRQTSRIVSLSARLTQAEARAAGIQSTDAATVSELRSLRDHVDCLVKRESLNVVKQLEAFDSVRSAVGGRMTNPPLHGWPISADFAAYMLRLLHTTSYDLVVEFGSGTSTAILAAALARRPRAAAELQKVRQIAFEHLPEYHDKTRAQLRDLNLDFDTDQIVHLAPLSPYMLSTGEIKQFYNCKPSFEALHDENPGPPLKILVIVDGPPGTTEPLARYPALDAVREAYPDSRLSILLDDYFRADEKEIVEQWKADLRSAGRTFNVKTLDFEKGACLLEVAGRGTQE